MNREKILKKAIKKAMSNGWQSPYTQGFERAAKFMLVDNSYMMYVFSHDFCKAFWSQTDVIKIWIPQVQYTAWNSVLPITRKGHYISRSVGRSWKWHLQQMVLEENPLKYLEKFLVSD